MRLRVVSLFISCVALGAVWACSLNPQPLPPDGYDASDAALSASPDGAGGTDASTEDGGVPMGGDASTDAGDAGDAAEDARDDADAMDAGDDG